MPWPSAALLLVATIAAAPLYIAKQRTSLETKLLVSFRGWNKEWCSARIRRMMRPRHMWIDGAKSAGPPGCRGFRWRKSGLYRFDGELKLGRSSE